MCANGFLYVDQIDEFYQESFLSLIYSGLSLRMGYTALSGLLKELGMKGNPVRAFEQMLIDECSGNVAIDGHVVRSASGSKLTDGEGAYTVTVGALETTVDASGAGEVPVWEDYAVENPFADSSASGEASGSAEASAPAAAGGYTADETGWKQYLKDYVSAVSAAQEHLDEFYAAIDAGAFDTMPGDMLFTDAYWGYAAVSYDAFVAAGGAVEIPAFDPNLVADAEP